jgi:hypothetical protein
LYQNNQVPIAKKEVTMEINQAKTTHDKTLPILLNKETILSHHLSPNSLVTGHLIKAFHSSGIFFLPAPASNFS